MAKDYAKQFYNSAAWQKTREAYLSSVDGICERCGGIAYIVHHKQRITPENVNDPAITLNWSNLMAVCYNCHEVIHQFDDDHSGRPMIMNGIRFDAAGNVVKAANVFLVCTGGNAAGFKAYTAAAADSHDLIIFESDTGREKQLQQIEQHSGRWLRAFIECSATNADEIRALAAAFNAEIIDLYPQAAIVSSQPENRRRGIGNPSDKNA